MSLRDQFTEQLKASMKAGDAPRTSTMRMILARLKDVDKPTLVIVGEHDRTTTTRAARVLHEGIPGSELHIVPGAGHMSFVEEPDDYLSTVRNFLARGQQ